MADDARPWWDYPRGLGGVRRFVEVGVIHGMSPAQCLVHTSIEVADLDDPDRTVEAHEELQTARNLLAAIGDRPGLGAEIGSRFTIASAGVLGFAVMSSPTLRVALDVGLRYVTLGSFFLQLVVTETDDEVRLTFDDSEVPQDVRSMLTERDVAALTKVLPLFLGAAGFEAVRTVGGSTLVMPHDMLDLPLPAADRHTARLFEQQCAELLDRRQVRRGTSGVVRGILLRHPAAMASMELVAGELHQDTRTLHRRLAAEGTSFRVLEAEVREGLAIELLSQAGLNVGEVARRLGYSEVAAFSRAFKRWTGEPPQQFRSRA